MLLVQRATGILMRPRPEWARIDHEPASTASLYTNYAAVLAAIPLAGQIVISLLLAGIGGLVMALVAGVFSLALGLAIVFVMGLIANALAPGFGGSRNDIGAQKLVVYAATPLWIAGIITAVLSVIPILGALIGFFLMVAAFGYTAYLIYLGSPVVMRVAPQQAMVYALAIAAIWLVLYLIVAAVIGVVVVAIFGAAMMAGAATAFR